MADKSRSQVNCRRRSLQGLSEVGRSRCYVPGKNGKDLAAEALTSLYLFGSVVRDKAKAASDLDLFIDYDRDGRGRRPSEKSLDFLNGNLGPRADRGIAVSVIAFLLIVMPAVAIVVLMAWLFQARRR
jgi:Polymerase beta, Nucleotidyltransferase